MLVCLYGHKFLVKMTQPKAGLSWLKGLADFVFPPLCLGCGEYTEVEYGVCDDCMRAIDRFSQPFCLGCLTMIESGTRCGSCEDRYPPLFAAGNYTAPLEQIIIQYKFKGIKRPSVMFARLVMEEFEDDIKSLQAEALIPIPLHPSREAGRGYNQAVVLSQHLSELLGTETRTDILYRTQKHKPQARLNLRQRAANISGVFEVDESAESGARVALVDDVVTSGATVREATRVLSEAGLEVAGVISIAHAV